MRFHDPEVDRIIDAAEASRQRLADAVRQRVAVEEAAAEVDARDRAAITDSACACYRGRHLMCRGGCGCPTCQPEENQP